MIFLSFPRLCHPPHRDEDVSAVSVILFENDSMFDGCIDQSLFESIDRYLLVSKNSPKATDSQAYSNLLVDESPMYLSWFESFLSS